MTRFDLAPLFRTGIGFDNMAKMLEQISNDTPSYPPYNIEKCDESHYRIVMAIAGFDQDDLDITIEKNILTITAKHQDKIDEEKKDDQTLYLHRGIAERSFIRRFNLEDHVNVTDASLKNGLLSIALEREIPEAMKARTISVRNGSDHDTAHLDAHAINEK